MPKYDHTPGPWKIDEDEYTTTTTTTTTTTKRGKPSQFGGPTVKETFRVPLGFMERAAALGLKRRDLQSILVTAVDLIEQQAARIEQEEAEDALALDEQAMSHGERMAREEA